MTPGGSFEPGGCTAFCSISNGNVLTHPAHTARDQSSRTAEDLAALRDTYGTEEMGDPV